jgi:polyphosphate glucokinase
MIQAVRTAVDGCRYDVVPLGYPGPVVHGKPPHNPVNLGAGWVGLGWVGFDFQKAFARPTQVVNDAAIQTLGSYRGGCMLFLGLGTGLGSALIVGVSDSQGPGIPGVPTATGAPGARRGATF